MGTSIVKLGERGTLVEGDMVRLAALDLVLWIVGARMVGIAFDLELASMHASDRATDAPGLGFPAHAVMDLEVLRHGRSIRCRRRTAKQAVLALNSDLIERHEHSNRCAPYRFPKIFGFCNAFLIFESGAQSQRRNRRPSLGRPLDREIADLFALQDAVTVELAGVFGVKLIEAESRCLLFGAIVAGLHEVLFGRERESDAHEVRL
jgi:hypothetical protein